MEFRPLDGRTCFVTGATSGIGTETAIGLARRGGRVILGGRDARRAEAARQTVVQASGNDAVEVALCDLASLEDVRRLSAVLRERCDALHVLVNNAGVVTVSRELTVDGYESMFAVNHLAHFLLTLELLPLIESGNGARIVVVASDAHRFARFDLEDLQSERGFGFPALVTSMRVYGAAKLANILFARELSRRLRGRQIDVNALHPGAVSTRLGSNNGALGALVPKLTAPFFLTPGQGAATSIHVASDPSLAGTTGAYFVRKRAVAPAPAARDDESARELWKRSCELVRFEGDTP